MGTSYIPVARVKELAPGAMKPVDMGGRQLVVANVAGEYFAFARECPHEAADLTAGQVVGEKIHCANHGYCFDLKTGNCEIPQGGPPLTVLPVEARGEDLCIRLKW